MRLRVRLILAFLLLSVLPLGAVTVYSYVTSYRALHAAAEREANELAAELSDRMQLVTTHLSERVEQLMDAPERAAAAAQSDEADVMSPMADNAALQGLAADALGEAAMLLNSIELQGLRRPPGSPARRDNLGGRRDDPGSLPMRRTSVQPPPTTASATPVLMVMPLPEPPALREPRGRSGSGEAPAAGTADATAETGRDVASTPIRIDVGPIARDIVRQFVPKNAPRIEALLTSAAPGGPEDVLERVESALGRFRGTREPFDDVTMMAVKVG